MESNQFILRVSVPLFMLVTASSMVGLLTPDFYSTETPNWQVQSRGQDMVDLFIIAPALLITAILAHRNWNPAVPMWGGVVMYLTYTFILFCFDVHFNRLFILYCLCLGLSFYALIYLLFEHGFGRQMVTVSKNSIILLTAIYFITIAVSFYFLWLAEIIPSIVANTVPKSTADAGLFTNGVHVLDLSIVLPGIFITGLLLLRHKAQAFTLAPAFLTFFVLMDITIGALTWLINQSGIGSSIILSYVMIALAALSLALLVMFFRSSRVSE